TIEVITVPAKSARNFAVLLDHLVGAGEDCWRHGQAERLGGADIDHQLDFGRLLHWQFGRLGTLQDLSGISAGLAIGSREARSIADQAAGSGELAPLVDRRNGVA